MMAIKEGRKEGKKQGIIEGRKYNIPIDVDTIKEGAIESKKQIAQKIISKGMCVEEISDITGLTNEEIENLKD